MADWTFSGLELDKMMLAPCSRAARATAKPMPEVPPMRRTRVLVSLLMEMKFIVVFGVVMLMMVGLYDIGGLLLRSTWLVWLVGGW